MLSLLAIDRCNIFLFLKFSVLHIKGIKMEQCLFQFNCLETLLYGFCVPSRIIIVTNFQPNL